MSLKQMILLMVNVLMVDLYFNLFTGQGDSLEENLEESMGSLDLAPVALQSYQAGIVLIYVLSASDLPYEKNMLKTSFNCDPFLVASFGKKTFRTRVVRHSLNPTWNQRIYLFILLT